MNILFWMDDPSTLNPKKDTTYLIIHESIQQGHNAYFIKDIGINNNQLVINAKRIQPFELNTPITVHQKTDQLTHKSIDIVWIRKDPPVNDAYMRDLLIFQQFEHQIKCLNHPLGVLKTNEKLAATLFPDITPDTLISQNKTDIIEFIDQFHACIIKPLNGYGGTGIYKVSKKDTNLDTIIETSSQNFTQQIVCQKAVNHANGDKRIILLNQKPLGAINRINPNGHRNNFMSGGHAEKTNITENDQMIINHIAPMLKKNGLNFVGIDIIDGHLIEINVTSPTGIQEINHLNHTAIEKDIVKSMEQYIKETTHA